MRIFAACLLLMSATPAFAEDCKSWTAQMEEDEGGPVMMAHICKRVPKGTHDLIITCGGEDTLAVRYLAITGDNFPPNDGDYSTDLEISAGQETFTQQAQFEAMDGALATSVKRGAFVEVLGANQELLVQDLNSKGKVPETTFTLKGAKKALAKLVKTCE